MSPSTTNAFVAVFVPIPMFPLADNIKSPLLLINSVSPKLCFKINCCGSPVALSLYVENTASAS